MASRAANFITAIFASVIAGAMTVSHGAPAATDDCLSGPEGEAPQGQHWYYRIDRATKRQCWYLREEGEKLSQDTAPAAASTSKPAAAPPRRSVQDAHAEVPMPQPAADQGTAATVAPAPATPAPSTLPRTTAIDTNAQQPAVASRWPDAPAAPPAVSAPAAPPAAPTVAVASPRQKQQAAPSPTNASATPAAAEVSTEKPISVEKPTGSIQTLLLVVLGALALAGLIGSVIYRFAGSRDRLRNKAGQRRRVNWEAAAGAGRAPWAGETPNFAPRAEAEFAPAPQAVAAQTLAPRTPAPQTFAPQTLAPQTLAPEPVPEPDRATGAPEADPIDIDQITEMLERLLSQGPKLDKLIAAAGSADYAQSRQDQSGVRA